MALRPNIPSARRFRSVSLNLLELEPRIAPAGVDLFINGDRDFADQNDIIRLVSDASDPTRLNVFINNTTTTPTESHSLASINQIVVRSLGGDDTLILDFSEGDLASAGGIGFDGGGGTNILQTVGGSFVTETYTPSGPASGTVRFTGAGGIATPNDPISWWKGEGNANDQMGLNPGTIVSGTSFAPAMVGQGFNMDGVDDRVLIADSPSLALTGSMTIEAWVRVDSVPSGHGNIFFRGDDRSSLDPYFLSVEPDSTFTFHIESASANRELKTPVVLNQLVHLAATLDDATGTMRIYVNGVIAAETTTTVRPLGALDATENPGIAIGNHGGFPTTPFNLPFDGLIDDIAIFGRALSPGEVLAIFNAGSAGKGGTAGTVTTTINFSNVARLTDLAGVTSAVYNATNRADSFDIIDGPIAGGTQTTRLGSVNGTFAGVDLANKSSVTVNALNGNDTIGLNNLNRALGLATLSLNAGLGNDTVRIDNIHPAFGLTSFNVEGGAGANSLVGPNANVNWLLATANRIQALNAIFKSFQNIAGGDQRDVFTFRGAGQVTGRINGGGGHNWLDYSGIANSVAVHLAGGTGSRIGAGFANVRNVIGSAGGGDKLIGNVQGSVIVAHGNQNSITAAANRNLIIGGFGSNSLTGSRGDDLLIAGRTIYDANYDALEAILQTWKSADSYNARVAALRSGPTRLVAGETVFVHPSNGNRGPRYGVRIGPNHFGILVGNAGQDWYFVATAKSVADRGNRERVN